MPNVEVMMVCFFYTGEIGSPKNMRFNSGEF